MIDCLFLHIFILFIESKHLNHLSDERNLWIFPHSMKKQQQQTNKQRRNRQLIYCQVINLWQRFVAFSSSASFFSVFNFLLKISFFLCQRASESFKVFYDPFFSTSSHFDDLILTYTTQNCNSHLTSHIEL